MLIIKTYGRKTIKANYTEEELLSGSPEEIEKRILEILQNAIPVHEYNEMCTKLLKSFYLGMQDVLQKVKLTRTEINNKTVENWAYAFVDFKKCYLLGKPIQYVQLNDSGEKEIALLNKYVGFENKKAKDMLIYEDTLVCGRGFRYTNFKRDSIFDDDDKAPFELLNVSVEDTEVIYSNKLGGEQLLSFIKTGMETFETTLDPITKKEVINKIPYSEYTVYTRKASYVIDDKDGELKIRKEETKPIVLQDHVITEYYMNEDRISLIELAKDLFNDINYLESLDKDDMEQFVNAIMVFTNAEVDADGLAEIKDLGAVSISSTEGRKASVDLLQQRLNASDTQVYYNRLLIALHQILGVPIASDSGSVSYGDTGKARLTSQGYTMAGIRAEGSETMFGMCDRNSLKKIIKICKKTADSEITSLSSSDIEAKFQRDMSENLLIKTQALLNLYSADIPRKYANAIIGLFGDPNAITKEQESLFGEQVSQQSSSKSSMEGTSNTTNDDDIASQQDNKLNNVHEKNSQGDN